ncbi:MAG TPA: 50S ribosomal protein L11 methyltransferase [Longimicrobiaceae bacterium]|nr:50S ribosomal protein L11 methyltransferase [Longimicrobiaceae bacterium]
MIRLAIRAKRADAESVNAALLEVAPTGIEQVDAADHVEFALYGAPGELPSLPRGEAEIGGARVLVSGEEVPDDWFERWKRFHAPVLIGGTVYVRPPWEEPAVRPGVKEVVIDPGQAFGTGAHPTTRMCIEVLLGLARDGGSLADLGCGSGVLAIAAAKLGFAPVSAYDADRGAVAATLENARDNAVALERVERLDLRSELPPPADVMVANLMRPLLLRVAELMREPPKALIVSGLLDHEAGEVASAFRGLRERSRLTSKGWIAVLLVQES